jgi:hypothetical protein
MLSITCFSIAFFFVICQCFFKFQNYRARYESEGCRGPVHGSSELTFPTFQVVLFLSFHLSISVIKFLECNVSYCIYPYSFELGHSNMIPFINRSKDIILHCGWLCIWQPLMAHHISICCVVLDLPNYLVVIQSYQMVWMLFKCWLALRPIWQLCK